MLKAVQGGEESDGGTAGFRSLIDEIDVVYAPHGEERDLQLAVGGPGHGAEFVGGARRI